MKPWHITSGILAALLFLIVIFAASTVGGFFMLLMLPTLVAWGWTLHERQAFVKAETERKILEKYNINPKAASKEAKAA